MDQNLSDSQGSTFSDFWKFDATGELLTTAVLESIQDQQPSSSNHQSFYDISSELNTSTAINSALCSSIDINKFTVPISHNTNEQSLLAKQPPQNHTTVVSTSTELYQAGAYPDTLVSIPEIRNGGGQYNRSIAYNETNHNLQEIQMQNQFAVGNQLNYEAINVYTKSLCSVESVSVPKPNIFAPRQPCNFHHFPSLIDFPGNYGFEISFGEKTESARKNTDSTYSYKLKKLFVKIQTLHPVMFKTNSNVPEGTILRATLVFSEPESISENVKRCVTHYYEDKNLKSHVLQLGHLSPQNLYYATSDYGRESVCIPFPHPESGSEFASVLFKYTCRSSCVGGINRRPISVLFTLECDQQVIGRRVVKVKICSCPGRDRGKEEDRKRPNSNVVNPTTSAIPAKKHKIMLTKPKKPSATPETDTKVYILAIKGRKNYELLTSIKEILEVISVVKKDDASVIKQHNSD